MCWARNVVEVRVADQGLRVPCKHGVDSLGEFSAAGAVDAACIDPKPFDAVRLCKNTAFAHFWGSVVAWDANIGAAQSMKLVEGHLVVLPNMGEDCVAALDITWAVKVFELPRACTDEPHLLDVL